MTTNELIAQYMGLIKKIANKFYNISKEDLIQVGVIGLLKAYQNFKDNQAAKFSTYAYPYIFGEMYTLANNNRNIKISKDLLKLYKCIEKTRYELAQRLKRIPSNLEIAQFLELDYRLVEEAIGCCTKMISLDEEANELNLHEVIAEPTKISNDLKIDLANSFKALNDNERKIIKARYYEDLTQNEIAQKLKMTQVMVSRYEKKGLEKMRIALM